MATFAKPGTTSLSAEEVKSDMEGPLPSKRKPELASLDGDNIHEADDDSNKKQKLEISSVDKDGPLIPDLEGSKSVSEAENNGIGHNEEVEEGEDEDDEDEDEEDFEGDEEDNYSEDEDDEPSNGGAEVNDPKGKGILKDEKGKGKLIEESEDSSDSGSESDGDDDGDGDSDLSDDPLAEVDLDNILPSRTRRRGGVQPGIYISNDQRK